MRSSHTCRYLTNLLVLNLHLNYTILPASLPKKLTFVSSKRLTLISDGLLRNKGICKYCAVNLLAHYALTLDFGRFMTHLIDNGCLSLLLRASTKFRGFVMAGPNHLAFRNPAPSSSICCSMAISNLEAAPIPSALQGSSLYGRFNLPPQAFYRHLSCKRFHSYWIRTSNTEAICNNTSSRGFRVHTCALSQLANE